MHIILHSNTVNFHLEQISRTRGREFHSSDDYKGEKSLIKNFVLLPGIAFALITCLRIFKEIFFSVIIFGCIDNYVSCN